LTDDYHIEVLNKIRCDTGADLPDALHTAINAIGNERRRALAYVVSA
jgi:hypothetical protein